MCALGHRHREKLEFAREGLEAGEIHRSQLQQIQEDVQYFLDSYQEPDFVENEDLYDVLNESPPSGDEEMDDFEEEDDDVPLNNANTPVLSPQKAAGDKEDPGSAKKVAKNAAATAPALASKKVRGKDVVGAVPPATTAVLSSGPLLPTVTPAANVARSTSATKAARAGEQLAILHLAVFFRSVALSFAVLFFRVLLC